MMRLGVAATADGRKRAEPEADLDLGAPSAVAMDEDEGGSAVPVSPHRTLAFCTSHP